VVRSDGEAKAPVLYRGEDAVEHFLTSLQVELAENNEVFKKPVDMIMTANDCKAFNDSVHCHICGEALVNDRVRDHCHITGKYRGAAHNACNLKLRIYPDKTKVPVACTTSEAMMATGSCQLLECLKWFKIRKSAAFQTTWRNTCRLV